MTNLAYIPLKILLLGDGSVGKTSLIRRFVDQDFEDNLQSTVCFDVKSWTSMIQGYEVKVTFWDTAGAESFHSLTPNLLRNTHGALLVYDVTNRPSLNHVKSWLDELEQYSGRPEVITMLVGNKIDLPNRNVPKQDATNIARECGMMYFETSAKTNENVQVAFEELIKKVVSKPAIWEDSLIQRSTTNQLKDKDVPVSSAAYSGCSC